MVPKNRIIENLNELGSIASLYAVTIIKAMIDKRSNPYNVRQSQISM